MKCLIIVFGISLLLFSCKEEKEEEVVSPSNINSSEVIVLNEGNFQWGNASLSLYNADTKTVELEVFARNNQQTPIGDVVQSMVKIDNKLFTVVNNSSRIRVLDQTSFIQVGVIDGLNSPRYILPINATKAYVSDLYQDEIYVINPSNYSVVKTIPSKGWTEEMVLVGNRAFVCQVDSNQVWVFDTRNDSLLKKISTYTSPLSIEVDQNQEVWVSCSGGLQNDLGAIQKINSNSLAIEKTLAQSSSDDFVGEIEMNANQDEIYYLNLEGLSKINIQDTVLASRPLITRENRTLYGFSIHNPSNEIYLCDALDYLQKGNVYRYTVSGNLIDVFQVGIIPGDVYFKN